MKIRSLLVTAALVIAVAILILQRSQISKLTAERQAANQPTDAAPETPADTNKTPTSPAAAPDQSAELLRLRAEVTALRRQTNELARMRTENARMREALAAA